MVLGIAYNQWYGVDVPAASYLRSSRQSIITKAILRHKAGQQASIRRFISADLSATGKVCCLEVVSPRFPFFSTTQNIHFEVTGALKSLFHVH